MYDTNAEFGHLWFSYRVFVIAMLIDINRYQCTTTMMMTTSTTLTAGRKWLNGKHKKLFNDSHSIFFSFSFTLHCESLRWWWAVRLFPLLLFVKLLYLYRVSSSSSSSISSSVFLFHCETQFGCDFIYWMAFIYLRKSSHQFLCLLLLELCVVIEYCALLLWCVLCIVSMRMW